MKRAAALLLAFSLTAGPAQATQVTYDKEQIKKDYRALLEQIKALNGQYKGITGEIGQLFKEEGVPTWEAPKVDLGETKDGQKILGEGAYLKETPKDMVLTVDMPGFQKESIKLKFWDGLTLDITAHRTLETMTRSFERTFTLPSLGDQKNSQATYLDGVLTVKIPKLTSQETSILVK